MTFNNMDHDYLIMTEGKIDEEFKISDLLLGTSDDFDPFYFRELCLQSVWSLEINNNL